MYAKFHRVTESLKEDLYLQDNHDSDLQRDANQYSTYRFQLFYFVDNFRYRQ